MRAAFREYAKGCFWRICEDNSYHIPKSFFKVCFNLLAVRLSRLGIACIIEYASSIVVSPSVSVGNCFRR